MSKKNTLCISPSCGPCSMLKSKLSKLGLEVEVKDYSLAGDREFFIKHEIRSVPRLVVEDGENVTIIQGIDEIIKEIENV